MIERLKHIFFRIFSPDVLMRKKYRAFRALLEFDDLSHRLMARLEEIRHEGKRVDFCAVRKIYEDLANAISGMIEQLRNMAPSGYEKLADVFQRIDADIRSALVSAKIDRSEPHLLMLNEINHDSEYLVGGKASNLAIISRDIQLPIPSGFVITASAFWYFVEFNRLEAKIHEVLAALDVDSTVSMGQASEELQAMIQESPLPDDLEQTIIDFYTRLWRDREKSVSVSLRSSAVAEDSEHSFAGQYQSVLNVDRENLAEAYKKVIASKYSAKAISYRVRSGLLDSETPMAVLVTEMLDARASGILYTKKPFASSADAMTIYSVWGLAEPLVRGRLSPDIIEVSRESTASIVNKQQVKRDKKAVLSPGSGIEMVDLDPQEVGELSLSDEHALKLVDWGLKLESYYGLAQDIEWCMDRAGELFLLQARQLGLEEAQDSCESRPIEVSNQVLLSGGDKAASGAATGNVVQVSAGSDLQQISAGAVLVAPATAPIFAQVIDKLAAIVTDVGSVAGHLASVARENRVPTLVNTRRATRTLRQGQTVTVDADNQRVYEGAVEALASASCDRQQIKADSSFQQRLRHILKYTSPLNLTNPREPSFSIDRCQTLNDILRFAHEKAIEEMFALSKAGRGKIRGAEKLKSDIPISLYVLDLGSDAHGKEHRNKELTLEALANPALRALWEGLSHPNINWSALPRPFDWKEFDRFSAGIVDVESQLLASFALVGKDYLNINIRFGYHFVVVDAVCSNAVNKNYISLRFEGGGGDYQGRCMRVQFLAEILEKLGFEAHPQGDMITARLRKASRSISEQKLKTLGHLLGYTRLLDIGIGNREQAQEHVQAFLRADAGTKREE